MADTVALLAEYIAALRTGAAATREAQERPVYKQRLAAAAVIFEALYHRDSKRLKALLDQEERNEGRGFLSGEHGHAVSSAFATFLSRARLDGHTIAT